MLCIPYNLKILENVSTSEKYRKTAIRRNWSKFAEIAVSVDVIISDTENTLHLLYSLHVPRQYTLYRQSSPSGVPYSYLYKLHMSTLDFEQVFPFLKIFVFFYHCFFFVFRLTFCFLPFRFSFLFSFLVFVHWSFLSFLLYGDLVIISDFSPFLFVILTNFGTFQYFLKGNIFLFE